MLTTQAPATRRPATVILGSTIVLGFAAAGASAVFAATGGTLSGLIIAPHTVDGGTPAVGTLTMTAAVAEDTVVTLSSTDTTAATVPATTTIPAGATTGTFTITTHAMTSSDPAVASVPSEVVVEPGKSSAVFAVTTSAVTTATPVTITATADGTSASGTLTVDPGTPPAPDTVRVTKATWSKRLLTIQATTTNPNAILSVLDSEGGFMFTLTNVGGGRFQDQRGWLDNPLNITVRSNFGGAASAATH